MREYTNPQAHGFIMEAKGCAKVIKELERLITKYEKAVKRESDARKAEFETVMGYQNEGEIQNDYGYDCISEKTYRRYLEIFRKGQAALENPESTVNDIALFILRRIKCDIIVEQKDWEFESLSPEEQEAERKRAAESQKRWKKEIADIKKRMGIKENTDN